MEPINIDEIVVLENDKEYYVVDIINHDNKKYVYLISEAKEVMLALEKVENGEVFLETLDDAKLTEELLKKLIHK